MEIREKVLETLKDVRDDVDYENCKTLFTDKVLDSFAILTILSEFEDEFDIEITPKELKPDNFNSLDAIVAMVESLIEK